MSETTAVNASEKSEVKKPRAPLSTPRMLPAEGRRNVWSAVAEHGVTLQDVLVPGYWSTVAPQLHPLDLIEVDTDDGKWCAWLKVIACNRNWAKVTVLVHKEIDDAEKAPAEEEYEVRFAGPHLKWRVLRRVNGAVIKEGMTSELEARTFLRQTVLRGHRTFQQ